MVTTIIYNGIPIRGKQRLAVYKALSKPATARRILSLTRQSAPSMSYQDLRHILRDFQKKEIVTCLNPDCQTGRIYRTNSGATETAIGSDLINICSRIDRAKSRMAVLGEVARKRYSETAPLTATQIKKLLREHYSMGLNHVLAALKFLEQHALVEVAGFTEKRELKIYRITGKGQAVLNHLSSE
jgi:Fe2+ or Zn2+ uptake regulation protein